MHLPAAAFAVNSSVDFRADVLVTKFHVLLTEKRTSSVTMSKLQAQAPPLKLSSAQKLWLCYYLSLEYINSML